MENSSSLSKQDFMTVLSCLYLNQITFYIVIKCLNLAKYSIHGQANPCTSMINVVFDNMYEILTVSRGGNIKCVCLIVKHV